LKTADLYDRFGEELQVAEPGLVHFGGETSFSGTIATVVAPEDNSLVRRALESPGRGRVLVVDGGGSRRVALLGDQLAALAVANEWSGVVVHGLIRDSLEIGEMPLGVLALGTIPRKTEKLGRGEADREVAFAGVTFRPGEFLVADPDGLVLSAAPPA